ncbi:MAG: hypothetical protein AMDU4_FER2C00169G0001 [Ferroplasma sp. Type II]|nr:MAG: hypothetical protein AMDU4_FER2C00169G0001 [Ferroplasma sp. Type II]
MPFPSSEKSFSLVLPGMFDMSASMPYWLPKDISRMDMRSPPVEMSCMDSIESFEESISSLRAISSSIFIWGSILCPVCIADEYWLPARSGIIVPAR